MEARTAAHRRSTFHTWSGRGSLRCPTSMPRCGPDCLRGGSLRRQVGVHPGGSDLPGQFDGRDSRPSRGVCSARSGCRPDPSPNGH